MDQKTGFIIENFDPDGVAGIISRLVDDPGAYQAIIREARRQVEERFTIDCAVDQIEQVLIEAALSGLRKSVP